MPSDREIFFHEDDYCQQQLLPAAAAAYAQSELLKIGDFADRHRATGGAGWTDLYIRRETPPPLRTLQIPKVDLDRIFTQFLHRFDKVYTGYSSYREACRNTAAWGICVSSVLFADWDDAGIIQNIWTHLFNPEDSAISAAAGAIAMLCKFHPLIFVDWEWGYVCDAGYLLTFASMLRSKLGTIANQRN